MRPVPFIQYLRPNGEPRVGGFDRPEPVAAKADEIRKAGHRLEAEELTTGLISLTIAGYDKAKDWNDALAIQVVPNGPGVMDAVDKLIMEFEL